MTSRIWTLKNIFVSRIHHVRLFPECFLCDQSDISDENLPCNQPSGTRIRNEDRSQKSTYFSLMTQEYFHLQKSWANCHFFVDNPPRLPIRIHFEKDFHNMHYLGMSQRDVLCGFSGYSGSWCHVIMRLFVLQVVGRECSALLAAHYRLDAQPHVNPLHEVLVGDKHTYLVFPRAHGDLHSHVRARKRLREPEARRLFRQMAETVRACHDHGIVLRDLKLRKFVFADSQR